MPAVSRFHQFLVAVTLGTVVLAAGGSALAAATTGKPLLSHFSPLSVKPLATLTIDGTNFTGVKTVKVDGVVAKFKVASKTKITAIVPSKAKSGKVIVTTAAGSVTSKATLKVLPAAPATATVIGNAAAGKALFIAHCSACHTLAAAGAEGTLGPILNGASLTEAVLIKAITDGGASVMSPAAAGEYSTTMTAYGGALSTVQIDDIAAFVYNATH